MRKHIAFYVLTEIFYCELINDYAMTLLKTLKIVFLCLEKCSLGLMRNKVYKLN